jgi:CubicO group peptidase (beta-lactamase class C family)
VGDVDAVVRDWLAARGGRGPTGVCCAVWRAAEPSPRVLAVGTAQAYDERGRLAHPRPVDADTRFDLGSVTKVVGTTLLAMRLRAAGLLDLDVPVRAVLPAFAGAGKDAVTPRMLLLHRGGLWEWWPLYAEPGVADPVTRAAALPLRYRPDEGRHYSDIGFILLGAVLARVGGAPLGDLVRREVLAPLGLAQTSYGPLPGALRARVAATSTGDGWERRMIAIGEPYPVSVAASGFTGWREHVLTGEVNDGNAQHAFAGTAAHAGLFSTASDVCRAGRFLVDGADGWSVAEFLTEGPDPGQALGWRTRLHPGVVAGAELVGHPGFPGVELLVDRRSGTAVSVLTNRLHPTSRPEPIDDLVRLLLTAAFEGVQLQGPA